jgi:hypothetical protein
MTLCIAEDFPRAIAWRPTQEPKAIKTTVFDLQMDPGQITSGRRGTASRSRYNGSGPDFERVP